MPGGSLKRILVGSSIGLFFVIIFGLLWLFLAAPANPEAGFGWYLFAFAAGLSMIVLPCTLPLAFVIVPLSMGRGVAKGIGVSLAFGIGVVTTLSIYGVLAAIVGKAAIGGLGAPLETVKNWVYFIAGIFAYTFALSEIGLAKFRMPSYKGAAPAFIQKQQDFVKAFLLGLFLGNIGVGCPHPATPLILIEIASSGNVFYGWTLFLVHAVGRILPLLLLAFLGIMGVNGLQWLVARKDKVEKATGWAMVFIAGFILTLGLFTHKWWVNSGIHSYLEKITQEERFLSVVKDNLNSTVTHSHGLEAGTGLFGLPLWIGYYFLVALWVIPLWWWWVRERRRAREIPPEKQISERDAKLLWLSAKEWFLVALSLLLFVVFARVLPHNFQFHISQEHGRSSRGEALTYFSRDIRGLPEAVSQQKIALLNGDEYEIRAGYVAKEINGKNVRMLAYNGSVPGPLLRVVQGAKVKLVFMNGTDIGQTIHSHGVRLENAFDGVPEVTQKIVAPGESFTYEVIFPDSGVYWYHPHTRDDYGQELGLYGNYVVSSKDKSMYAPVNREEALMIDDILLDASGNIAPFAKERTTHSIMGRFGNTMLINGDSNFSLKASKGETIRLQLTNAANARTFNFAIPSAKLKLIGADAGLYQHEEYIESVLISPSERLIIDAYFPESGTFLIQNETPEKVQRLGIVEVSGESVSKNYSKEFFKTKSHPLEISDEEISDALARNPDKRLRLTVSLTGAAASHNHGEHSQSEPVMPNEPTHEQEDEEGHMHGSLLFLKEALAHGISISPKGIEWEDTMATMNALSNDSNTVWKLVDEDTGKTNNEISSWKFEEGGLVKVRITNDPDAQHPMQHPIHFHGQRFLVLAENGLPNQNLAWKDTALVRTGAVVDLLVEMSNPGVWMGHCHISEHLHSGMMFSFAVGEAAAASLESLQAASGAQHSGAFSVPPSSPAMSPDGSCGEAGCAAGSSMKEGREANMAEMHEHIHGNGVVHDHSAASDSSLEPCSEECPADGALHRHEDGSLHQHEMAEKHAHEAGAEDAHVHGVDDDHSQKPPLPLWGMIFISLILMSGLSYGVHKFILKA